MGIDHHLYAKKIDFFIVWIQTAVKNSESDSGLLPKNEKFNKQTNFKSIY